jgi:hypothetical protein
VTVPVTAELPQVFLEMVRAAPSSGAEWGKNAAFQQGGNLLPVVLTPTCCTRQPSTSSNDKLGCAPLPACQ